MSRNPGPTAGDTQQFGRRRARLYGLLLAIPASVMLMGWLSIRDVRGVVIEQIEATELLAADLRAEEMAAMVTTAERHLAAFARTPAVVAATSAGDLPLVHGQLTVLAAPAGTLGVAVRFVDGTEVLLGDDPPADLRTGPQIDTIGDRTSARLTVGAPVAGADGSELAWVTLQLDIAVVSPNLSQLFADFNGRTSLLRRDGAVVMSSTPPPSGRVESAALLEQLERGERGVVTYDSVQLGGRRIAAVVPVAGTDVMVAVGADAAAAQAPVAGLERQLITLVSLTLLLILAVLLTAMATVRGGRRQLETAQRAATRLAHTDPLTGLANRRAFDEELEATRGPFAVVMADIDLLKVINDEHGHAVGDDALRSAARAITAAIRPGDLAARVGGDEFAVLLPATSASIAREIGERIRHSIRQSGGIDFPLSASIGVAAGSGSDGVDLVLGADAALYAAKAARHSD